MNKKLLASFMVFALIVSMLPMKSAEAHSVLQNSTPKEGATLEETVKRIELSFNTKIENGSTLYVLNQKEEKIKPSSVNLNDNVLQANFEENLPSGTYQVNWKILGADGHLIKNQYRFTISAAQESSPDKEQDNQETKDKTTQEPETSKPDDSTLVQETDERNGSQQVDNNESSPSPFMYGIIIFITIAGAFLLFWMLFSKRKK
ncbi:copper resistance CopC family protein [Halobacillus amylolyticus]|uniref:Copper resistance protein CopC n=1 Tax=Halobacillus amylolyticus TaxID=2932259 RepID=A0ABY4HJM3_9BACI|nr:copper resistance protein CopC [Halobacillus amylolyticus]UOR14115.1 copper resistance protein CopC [Halobacillus amylolyticus]